MWPENRKTSTVDCGEYAASPASSRVKSPRLLRFVTTVGSDDEAAFGRRLSHSLWNMLHKDMAGFNGGPVVPHFSVLSRCHRLVPIVVEWSTILSRVSMSPDIHILRFRKTRPKLRHDSGMVAMRRIPALSSAFSVWNGSKVAGCWMRIRGSPGASMVKSRPIHLSVWTTTPSKTVHSTNSRPLMMTMLQARERRGLHSAVWTPRDSQA